MRGSGVALERLTAHRDSATFFCGRTSEIPELANTEEAPVKVWILLIAALLSFACSTIVMAASALDPEQAERLRAILDAPLPDAKEHTRPQLAQIYVQRGKAAGELGDSERAVKEFNLGIQAVGAKNPASYELHHELAGRHADRGEHRLGMETRKAALAVARTVPRQLTQVSLITLSLSTLGEREEARQFVARAEGLLAGARSHPGWANNGDLWTARVAMASARFHEAFGYLKEAEENFRLCTVSLRAHLRNRPDGAQNALFSRAYCTQRWIEVALRLGRLREASAFADDLRESAQRYADAAGRPLFVSRMAPATARLYIEQGLLREAEDLLANTIAHYTEEVLDEDDVGDSGPPVVARRLLASIEMLQGNWQKAEERFHETKPPVSMWGYTLLRQGKIEDARQMLDQIVRENSKRYDEKSLNLWENRAFHALAVGASGQREEALKTLSRALPKILELSRPDGTAGEAGLLNTARLNWLIDGYITFLTDAYKSGGHVDGINIVSEAFRYSDIARGSRVQGALSAAILRASISDPTLAAVVRRSQDLEYQVKTTAEYLATLQSGKADPETEKLIVAKRSDLERLRTENEQAQRELKSKLPDYSELLSPKPLDTDGAQKLLRPNEALVSIYSTAQRTLIWAIPNRGETRFAALDLPSATIGGAVAKLRKSLDPTEIDIGQLPTFDFASAHDLYKKLLAPVETGWGGAQELLIVSHGSLSELPFSVLLTAGYTGQKTNVPFAEHGDAPWLLNKAAISYLPSVAGLAALRRGSSQQASRNFIGIGDPVFSSMAPGAPGKAIASRGIQRRNLAAAKSSAGANQNVLDLLQPLPDTEQEVREIAKILGADESKDLYLGRRASEQTVKASDLTPYRVVMFATHGLIPGELPNLSQPALALSNPQVTGEKEDGLLTLAEILGLKLRADWVVLSACNTASADGQATEAVSGLGRAFFFAGAKALLVSHWPVETISAKLITTELFKRQSTDARISRARALRDASLAVMKQSAKADRGSQSYSYAHPMFWAPFVVVGDGG
jgi:CHAT domain-containing protein